MQTPRIGERGLGILLGVGLVLFALHFKFQPLKEILFIPAVGFMCIALVVATMLARGLISWKNMGSKWVWIPMLVIVASFGIRLVMIRDADTLAAFFMGVTLFGVYLSARVLGVHILKPMVWATGIVALSAIIFGLFITPGSITGGLITNYCASAGFMILGFFASHGKYQKYLMVLVGLGLFFTGAAEALFAVAVLGVIVLIRRDYGKRLLLVIGAVLLFAGAWFVFGDGTGLYMEAWDNLVALKDVIIGNTEPYGTVDNAIGIAFTDRFGVIKDGLNDLALFGHGYTITNYEGRTVHNVPLIIVDQIGIAAGIAWVVATLYCLFKTRWKYLWLSVLVLSVFDHYIWTQFAPVWWCLCGVTTTVVIENDYLFKDKA
jgi:hypothetical protein